MDNSVTQDLKERPIRSFVRRQSRFSSAQQRYFDDMMGVIGLPVQDAPLNFAHCFGREAPCILEIGFGMGETTAHIAALHPELNYLGVEVHTPGVGSLCKAVALQGLSNIRIVQHDVVHVLQKMIPAESLAGVHIFFPDPWPKARHHKRRLVQSPFVALLASRIRTGGYIHAATDWASYAEQMLQVFSEEPLLQNTVGDFAPRPEDRPCTKFEARGLKLGHGVWDLLFKKR